MNEKIDLTEILKDCPKGWELYSYVHGMVRFEKLKHDDYPVLVKFGDYLYASFTYDGKIAKYPGGECCLFPSKDQRDWNKFIAPWRKKEKFDPKTLQPFDKVLVRDGYNDVWFCRHFSHIGNQYKEYKYATIGSFYKYCIPYNDETKHLLNTTDEAPEYYRYWED